MKIIIPFPPHLPEWKPVGESKVIADAYGLSLVGQEFQDPKGKKHPYVCARKNPGVTVCALTPKGVLVTVQQYKQGVRQRVFEFPAGVCKAGEEPEVAAVRELRKETGYVPHGKVISLLPHPTTPIHLAPRKLQAVFYLLVALDCTQDCEQNLGPDEGPIQVAEFTPLEFWQLFRRGELPSTETLQALLLAKQGGFIYF